MTPPRSAGLRVLFVDYSVGFGGATKSLGLVLPALPHIEKFILTCQQQHMIDRWYPGLPAFPYRRVMNYRNLLFADEWLEAHVPRWLRPLVRKAIAAADAVVSLVACARIVRLGRRLRIGLIHLNNGTGPREVLRAARILGVPVVAHARGFIPPIERREARGITHVIAVSDAVAVALDPTGAERRSVTTIHDPVDVDAFERTAAERARVRVEWNIAPDDVLVGIFGRVIRWKGQLEFVRAVIAAMRTNPRIRGALVGDHADATAAYYADVRELIETSGMKDRFCLMGYHEAVEPYYHAMDIVVHASIKPEPFGMVVPEAMAARKPIVAARAGGPPEVVTHGYDGFLVRPGDVRQMAGAIAVLASSDTLRRRMGERGFAKVRERLSVAAVAAQMSAVYDVILSGII